MNESFLRHFSSSTQRVLRYLAKTPQDAVHFHERITVVYAALMIGREVVEQAVHEKPDDDLARMKAGIATTLLAVTTGLECAMEALKTLHPGELGTTNKSNPPTPPDRLNDTNRIRRIDTD